MNVPLLWRRGAGRVIDWAEADEKRRTLAQILLYETDSSHYNRTSIDRQAITKERIQMERTDRRYELSGILLTLAGGVCWGFSGACGQYLLQHRGLDAGWLVSFRMLTAGGLLLLISVLRAQSIHAVTAMWRTGKSALRLLAFGLLGMAMCQLTYFVTIGLSNAGTATVLEYLSPVLIMLYVSIRHRRRPGASKIVVLILALAGTLILSTHGNFGELAISREALIWGLASAVAYALNNLLPGSLMDDYGTLPIVGWGMVLGGLATSIPYRVWQPRGTFDGAAILALAGVIVVGTLLSYTGYMEGVRRIGPEKANLYACVEPLSATLFAVLWLKSDIQAVDLAGFACILLAVTLLSLRREP